MGVVMNLKRSFKVGSIPRIIHEGGVEMKRLENEVGIVTGGGHGIGRVYCRGLAEEGAKIVVADIDLSAAQETKKLVEQDGGSAIAVRVDVADEPSALAMAQAAAKAYGKIDILINNAAVFVTVPISRASF